VASDLQTPTEPSRAEAPPAEPAPREWNLDELLASRRWIQRNRPFPHVYARDVFTAEFYQSLHEEFERIERHHPEVFQRTMKGYDASGASISRFREGPLGVFVSREWNDLIARVAGVRTTGDVNAALHHHDPGSASGWPHNDLNPSWFAGPPPQPDEVRLENSDGVGVITGEHSPGLELREVIRGVSLLFYLGNPEWEPGDGGETGLFTDVATAGRGPAVAVPPINNSMVFFECTPRTWHTFIGNRKPRNAVVMWLHRPKDEAVQRWGDENIEYW
jgi:hypothetical protein